MEAILKKEIISDRTLRRLFGVSVFVILTTLGAFVRIPLPFTPVPITLQTLFVLLSGAILGSNLGAIAQSSYIFLGMLGAPIFTGAGSGLFYLFGPTAGYLFGFVLSAFWVGKFIKYGKNNLFLTFVVLFIADLILLLSGVIWLKLIFGYTIVKLLFIGFIPFIPGDLLKALVAALLYLKLKSRVKELF
jgi:biotin transport system substrate-specific component